MSTPMTEGSRTGSWMQTYQGQKFWALDPYPAEIGILDIAHSLSMQCRYAGHCLRFYSVAEHCWHVASRVSQENKLWALLHDASEAYLVDVPRPVKASLSRYQEIEERLLDSIADRFGLPRGIPAEVKEIDNRILLDERAQNMAQTLDSWGLDDLKPAQVTLRFWSPEEARYRFLKLFQELTRS